MPDQDQTPHGTGEDIAGENAAPKSVNSSPAGECTTAAGESTAPEKRQFSPVRAIAITVICIVIVLILANFNALLQPFRILNSVLAPIIIGLVIAYIGNPFLRFYEYRVFRKVKRPRVNLAVSMIAAYLTMIAIIGGVAWLVVPQVVGSINDLRNNGMSYITTLVDFINRIISYLPIPGNEDHLVSFEKLLTYLLNWISGYGSKLIGNIGTLLGSVITVLKNILVGVFVSIYVLLSKDRLNAGCRRVSHALLSPKKEEMLLHYISTAHQKFGGFIIGKMFDSMMVGIISGILFNIFRIPYATLVAVIVGVTDFIPFFGPFIGAIPSALIIFIVSPSKAFLFVILILIVQQIDGNLVAPWILGDRTGLSSLGVLVAVTVMGNLLGVAGMVLGVPIFALLMAVLDDFICFRLKKKGEETDLYAYYPATAFIRPEDIDESKPTMTQRFVRWVRAVETEEVPEPGTPAAKKRRFNRRFRRMCLMVGRFFQRLFSMHPLPEDQKGTIYNQIMAEGMKESRGFVRAVLLSVCTVLVYPLYLIEITAQYTNLACARDNKRTWGVFSYILANIFTLGLFGYFWHCSVISRWQDYCEEHGVECPITHKYFLLWGLLGLPIVVGPFFALSRFLKGLNLVAQLYNKEHPVKKKR